MSKIKEEFHEEINAGMSHVVPEPYMFKYTVYFHFGGKPYTVFADTHEKIAEIVGRIIPDFQCIIENTREIGYAFDCGDWILPVRLFENQNPVYA
jgi:hypothetical protein